MQYAAMLKMCSMQNHYPPEKKGYEKFRFYWGKNTLNNSYIISNVCKADTTLLQHRIFTSMTFPYHSTTWVMSV